MNLFYTFLSISKDVPTIHSKHIPLSQLLSSLNTFVVHGVLSTLYVSVLKGFHQNWIEQTTQWVVFCQMCRQKKIHLPDSKGTPQSEHMFLSQPCLQQAKASAVYIPDGEVARQGSPVYPPGQGWVWDNSQEWWVQISELSIKESIWPLPNSLGPVAPELKDSQLLLLRKRCPLNSFYMRIKSAAFNFLTLFWC